MKNYHPTTGRGVVPLPHKTYKVPRNDRPKKDLRYTAFSEAWQQKLLLPIPCLKPCNVTFKEDIYYRVEIFYSKTDEGRMVTCKQLQGLIYPAERVEYTTDGRVKVYLAGDRLIIAPPEIVDVSRRVYSDEIPLLLAGDKNFNPTGLSEQAEQEAQLYWLRKWAREDKKDSTNPFEPSAILDPSDFEGLSPRDAILKAQKQLNFIDYIESDAFAKMDYQAANRKGKRRHTELSDFVTAKAIEHQITGRPPKEKDAVVKFIKTRVADLSAGVNQKQHIRTVPPAELHKPERFSRKEAKARYIDTSECWSVRQFARRAYDLFVQGGGLHWVTLSGKVEPVPFWQRRSLLPRDYYAKSHGIMLTFPNPNYLAPLPKWESVEVVEQRAKDDAQWDESFEALQEGIEYTVEVHAAPAKEKVTYEVIH